MFRVHDFDDVVCLCVLLVLSLVCDRINGLGLICEFVFVSSEGGDECLKQRRGFEAEVIILTVCWCFIWISSRL